MILFSITLKRKLYYYSFVNDLIYGKTVHRTLYPLFEVGIVRVQLNTTIIRCLSMINIRVLPLMLLYQLCRSEASKAML